MELTVFERKGAEKSEITKIRAQGDIPAIIYASGQKNENIFVKGSEFQAALRRVKGGHLPTTIFTLQHGKKVLKTIVKDIQYHSTTYQILHIDFMILQDKVLVDVSVPIECIGAEDSPGVKLGGTLRQVIRWVKVRCLPKHIPSDFQISVSDLGIMNSKKLSDIAIPKEVRPLAVLSEVVVVISKRT
ncbi:MAG: 50S ribosomal protein L25/general stress protein Ctc [Chlamydiota bacterium]